MNWTPLYIIPGLIFLFWALVHLLLGPGARMFRIVLLLLLASFFMATGDILFGIVFGSNTGAHLLVQFMGPSTILLVCLYFAHLWRDVKLNFIHILCSSVPVVLVTAATILAAINGWQETEAFLERFHNNGGGTDLALNSTERSFYFWTVTLFCTIMAIEAILMTAYCIFLGWKFHFRPRNLFLFLSKKHARIRVLEIQVILALIILACICVKVFLLHPYPAQNMVVTPIWVLFLSAAIFFFGFFTLFSSREYISREEILASLRFEGKKETVPAIIDIKADTPSLSSTILGKVRSDDPLTAQFQKLMMGEQLFLQPNLTLTDVAKRLRTNKTYVSKMVNQAYNLGFPEVMNILRVDYAQAYILKHPEATQEDIAKACGFVSASTFNGTFKRITGLTPKVWAAKAQ